MNTTYNYARSALVSGGYDLDQYPGRVTTLAAEIETALPSKIFTIKCQETNCDITFDTALSAGDKTTLDGVVSDHQNNV